VLVGHRCAVGDEPFPLGGTRWATRRGRRGGRVPGFDPTSLKLTFEFVVNEIANICAGQASDVTAVHDVGGGGLAGALAEMASATGLGAHVIALKGHRELFSEFPGRFVMATNDVHAFFQRASTAHIPVEVLGTIGGDRLRIDGLVDLGVSEITSRREGALVQALDLDA
jgi:phosphoribosylformylglycinamidine (FGAM) synthase-like enzyme